MTHRRGRYCVDCGGKGPFPSEYAARCSACREQAEEERRLQNIQYQAARYKALKRLQTKYKPTYERFLEEERERLATAGGA